MELIKGGVCVAGGFIANGIHCGIRKNRFKRDLSLVVSDRECSAAAVYTTNLVKGAPLEVTKRHLKNGKARAVICNSGIANTCCRGGEAAAEEVCEIAAGELGLSPDDIVVASTGVIGQPLDLKPIRDGIAELAAGLKRDGGAAAEAILTTDRKRKEAAVKFKIGGKECALGGMAKGSGMIHPDMATMLVFVTTDVAISSDMLAKALKGDVSNTFNMVSIDGDTSTNDMVVVLANGAAGNTEITGDGEDFEEFMRALNTVTVELCREIAADGEGATKMLECRVSGAETVGVAKTVAKSVVCSSLLKAAMFGADANWGRVLCAIGYSGADVDVNRVEVGFRSAAGEITVCENGSGVAFPEDKAKSVLLEDEIEILVDLHTGNASATAWGCDLTYDYVKINSDYRN